MRLAEYAEPLSALRLRMSARHRAVAPLDSDALRVLCARHLQAASDPSTSTSPSCTGAYKGISADQKLCDSASSGCINCSPSLASHKALSTLHTGQTCTAHSSSWLSCGRRTHSSSRSHASALVRPIDAVAAPRSTHRRDDDDAAPQHRRRNPTTTLELIATNGGRLDAVLAEAYPERSRSEWGDFVKLGYVTVNDTPCTKKAATVKDRDAIVVELPASTFVDETTCIAEDLPLDLLLEDDHLLVVNKEAGMVTHPAPGPPDRHARERRGGLLRRRRRGDGKRTAGHRAPLR